MEILRRLKSGFLASSLVLLAACGGGGETPFAVGGSGGGGSGGGTATPVPTVPTLTVSLASNVITAAAATTVTMTLRDAAGQPVSGKVVTVAITRPTLAALSSTSALTDSAGVARVSLSAVSTAALGADELTATASVGTTTVTGVVGFQVSTPTPTMSALISNSTLSVTTGPATFAVTMRNANGSPLASQIVRFSSASNLLTLSAQSGLTDSLGVVAIQVSATDPRLNAADQIVAQSSVNGLDLSSTLNVRLVGEIVTPVQGSTLSLALSSTTLTPQAPATLTITLRDASGQPISGRVVSVSNSRTNLATLAASSVLTNAGGVATVTLSAAGPSVLGADEVIATTTVGTTALRSTISFQVVSQAPTLSSVMASTTLQASTGASNFTATVRDAAGAPLANQIVRFASANNLVLLSAASALTDTSGVAVTQVRVSNPALNAADQVTATATVAGVNLSSSINVRLVGEVQAAVASSSLVIALSSPTITPQQPAAVTVTLRDGSGAPISGRVVALSTSRTTLSTLQASSVLTDSLGIGRTELRAFGPSVIGADELVGIATLSTGTVQGSIGFQVTAATPTLAATISNATLRTSAGASTLTTTVRDTAGALLSGQIVRFSSASGRVALSAPSAITNGSGVATVQVTNIDPALNDTDEVVAAVRVAGIDLQSRTAVQLVGERPSIALSLSSSNISSTSPATVRALVLNTAGTPVSSVIVSFTTSFQLGSFSAATATSDINGIASVTLSPRQSSTAGADEIVATATVGGVAASDRAVVQFVPLTSSGVPTLALTLSNSSVSSASPATVTATLTDASGVPVAGQVITFASVRNLGSLNAGTALTNASGQAVVVLSPLNPSGSGADEVSASASFGGQALQALRGFQIQATGVSITAFNSAVPSLGAYGQTAITLTTSGASVGSPVNIAITSVCSALGKATVSPATFTATTAVTTLQYKDNGCGAVLASDQLQATIVGTANAASLVLPIATPAVSSLAFIDAQPAQIFLKGSGLGESSLVIFEVRDSAGNPLPNRDVILTLLTQAGGATLEGGALPITRTSDATGRVSARVNSGTVPTPLRVSATLSGTVISTVSSNLSVAVGLPSQMNFSLAQRSQNIEGYNVDGATNTYTVTAADRSGNPVPAGTSINFVTEGGQIEAIRQIALSNGLATTAANFVAASPRPTDGRVTITAYALGEESFIDAGATDPSLNGNNTWAPGKPFQALGHVFKDRLFNGYDAADDELVPLGTGAVFACPAPGSPLLALDVSIPSAGGNTCSSATAWTGAGRVYVRRAAETVLSTSSARPIWANTAGLAAGCSKLTLNNSPTTSQQFTLVDSNSTWYNADNRLGQLTISVADANPVRYNPMPQGTAVTAAGTEGLTVEVFGGTVPSTSEPSVAAINFAFADTPPTTAGTITLTFTSPGGVSTLRFINMQRGVNPGASCPP